MAILTRNRTRRNNGDSKKIDEVGKAVTKPEDLKLAEELRSKYLNNRKDPVGLITQCLSGIWARIEVHTGAYMFDMREHVVFYALFAVFVYLICASLIHAGARLVGYIL